MSGEQAIARLVQSMNRHLPARKKSLAQLLKEEKPSITARDNTVHHISKGELGLISRMVEEGEWDKLKLPIIIELTLNFGDRAARIHGRQECDIVRKILNLKKEGDKIIIYMPHVRELRRVLPTATQYGFYISLK